MRPILTMSLSLASNFVQSRARLRETCLYIAAAMCISLLRIQYIVSHRSNFRGISDKKNTPFLNQWVWITPNISNWFPDFSDNFSKMCTLTYGPVKFSCGHEEEETSLIACDENCGQIKKRVAVPKSTKRFTVCNTCKVSSLITVLLGGTNYLWTFLSETSQLFTWANTEYWGNLLAMGPLCTLYLGVGKWSLYQLGSCIDQYHTFNLNDPYSNTPYSLMAILYIQGSRILQFPNGLWALCSLRCSIQVYQGCSFKFEDCVLEVRWSIRATLIKGWSTWIDLFREGKKDCKRHTRNKQKLRVLTT